MKQFFFTSSVIATLTVSVLLIGCSGDKPQSQAPQPNAKNVDIGGQNDQSAQDQAMSCTYQESNGSGQLDCQTVDSEDAHVSIQTANQSEQVQIEDYQCSYSINGETLNGSSKAECDALKEQLAATKESNSPNAPQPAEESHENTTNTMVQCSFNINGELFEGDSKEECDKLKKDLGIDKLLEDILSGTAPTETSGGGSETVSNSAYKCQFNINGELFEGDSKEACDKIKKDLGL